MSLDVNARIVWLQAVNDTWQPISRIYDQVVVLDHISCLTATCTYLALILGWQWDTFSVMYHPILKTVPFSLFKHKCFFFLTIKLSSNGNFLSWLLKYTFIVHVFATTGCFWPFFWNNLSASKQLSFLI